MSSLRASTSSAIVAPRLMLNIVVLVALNSALADGRAAQSTMALSPFSFDLPELRCVLDRQRQLLQSCADVHAPSRSVESTLSTPLAVAAVLHACLSSVESSPESNVTSARPLRVIGPALALMSTLAGLGTTVFSANTGIPVEFKLMPFAQYSVERQAMLLDPTAPTATHGWDAIVASATAFGDVAQVPSKMVDLSYLVVRDRALVWNDVLPAFRAAAVTYDGAVVALPLSAVPFIVYYRLDIFERDNLTVPHTWEQFTELAELYHGRNNMSGACVMAVDCRSESLVLRMILASYIQTHGTKQGVYWDSETLEPLVNTPAGEKALTLFRRLVAVGSTVSGMPACVNDEFLKSPGCLMAITDGTRFKVGNIGPPNVGMARGRMGFTQLPGSTHVLDRTTRKLVPCDKARCPHAEDAAMKGGVPQLVNRPSTLTSTVVLINGLSPYHYQFYAYQLFALLSSPSILGARGSLLLELNELLPMRADDLSVAHVPLYAARGYDAGDTERFLTVCRQLAMSENVSPDLKIRLTSNVTAALLAASLTYNNPATDVSALPAVLGRLEATLNSIVEAEGGKAAFAAQYRRSINWSPRSQGSGGLADATSSSSPSGPGAKARSGLALAVAIPCGAVVLALALGAGLFVMRRRRGWSSKGDKGGAGGSPPGVGEQTTLVVTDIYDSTRLWEWLPAVVMDAAIKTHHRVIRESLLAHKGYESATEGDSFLLAFASAVDAVAFCLHAQQALLIAPWPDALVLLQPPPPSMDSSCDPLDPWVSPSAEVFVVCRRTVETQQGTPSGRNQTHAARRFSVEHGRPTTFSPLLSLPFGRDVNSYTDASQRQQAAGSSVGSFDASRCSMGSRMTADGGGGGNGRACTHRSSRDAMAADRLGGTSGIIRQPSSLAQLHLPSLSPQQTTAADLVSGTSHAAHSGIDLLEGAPAFVMPPSPFSAAASAGPWFSAAAHMLNGPPGGPLAPPPVAITAPLALHQGESQVAVQEGQSDGQKDRSGALVPMAMPDSRGGTPTATSSSGHLLHGPHTASFSIGRGLGASSPGSRHASASYYGPIQQAVSLPLRGRTTVAGISSPLGAGQPMAFTTTLCPAMAPASPSPASPSDEGHTNCSIPLASARSGFSGVRRPLRTHWPLAASGSDILREATVAAPKDSFTASAGGSGGEADSETPCTSHARRPVGGSNLNSRTADADVEDRSSNMRLEGTSWGHSGTMGMTAVAAAPQRATSTASGPFEAAARQGITTAAGLGLTLLLNDAGTAGGMPPGAPEPADDACWISPQHQQQATLAASEIELDSSLAEPIIASSLPLPRLLSTRTQLQQLPQLSLLPSQQLPHPDPMAGASSPRASPLLSSRSRHMQSSVAAPVTPPVHSASLPFNQFPRLSPTCHPNHSTQHHHHSQQQQQQQHLQFRGIKASGSPLVNAVRLARLAVQRSASAAQLVLDVRAVSARWAGDTAGGASIGRSGPMGGCGDAQPALTTAATAASIGSRRTMANSVVSGLVTNSMRRSVATAESLGTEDDAAGDPQQTQPTQSVGVRSRAVTCAECLSLGELLARTWVELDPAGVVEETDGQPTDGPRYAATAREDNAGSTPGTTSGAATFAANAGASSLLFRLADRQQERGDRVLVFRGLRVRMGLHSGITNAADISRNATSGRVQYSGTVLRLAKAVGDAGQGGMVLLSQATQEAFSVSGDAALQKAVGSPFLVLWMGEHGLPDELGNTHLYQIVSQGLAGRLSLQQQPGRPLLRKTTPVSLLNGVFGAPASGPGTLARLAVVGAGTLMAWDVEITTRAMHVLHQMLLEELQHVTEAPSSSYAQDAHVAQAGTGQRGYVLGASAGLLGTCASGGNFHHRARGATSSTGEARRTVREGSGFMTPGSPTTSTPRTAFAAGIGQRTSWRHRSGGASPVASEKRGVNNDIGVMTVAFDGPPHAAAQWLLSCIAMLPALDWPIELLEHPLAEEVVFEDARGAAVVQWRGLRAAGAMAWGELGGCLVPGSLSGHLSYLQGRAWQALKKAAVVAKGGQVATDAATAALLPSEKAALMVVVSKRSARAARERS